MGFHNIKDINKTKKRSGYMKGLGKFEGNNFVNLNFTDDT
jgi:hypothetical protein